MEQVTLTSTERSIKCRNKALAKHVLCHLLGENGNVPESVNAGVYFNALELKICRDNGLHEASLSEEWLQMFVDRLDGGTEKEEPAVEREFELHQLGDAHKYANEKYNELITKI